ncbi:MAG: GGDEF domain-containing protein [Syntrophobacterales bacterium]|nr:GGDEF domain-containing protein [Syntrophobacterales bacterium]
MNDIRTQALLDNEDCLIILNYATRLMALDLQREVLLERALEALSDFSANKNAALYIWRESESHFCLEGLFKDRRFQVVHEAIPFPGTPLEEIMINKEFHIYPNRRGYDYPMPAAKGDAGEGFCLCLPLAGIGAKIIGVVAVTTSDNRQRTTKEMQMLHILTTVIAISLENSSLFHLATHDSLTGLFIRNIFEIRLREELARMKRHRGVFSLLMLDIDHFKKINDTLGHDGGDIVLKKLAKTFKTCLRDKLDVVCRYGGDEFMILMTDIGAEEAKKIAARIHAQCAAQPLSIRGNNVAVTLSGGLLTVKGAPDPRENELIRKVDRLLYEAKARGRNNICADSI